MSFSEDEAEDVKNAFDDETLISPLDEATSLTVDRARMVEDDTDVFRHVTIEPGEIRLLQILPDTCEPFFHFGFKVFKRYLAPRYSAISYVWGSDEPKCQIFLHDKMFLIRENLLACLSSMINRKNLNSELYDADTGSIHFEDHLWIDAICIDQSQTTERNEQVRSMDEIYTRATSVLAWLGTTFEPNVGPLRTDAKGDFWSQNIHYLANRPYWSRMWIVQEFTLAKTVFIGCGRHWISEADFFVRIPHRIDPYAAFAFRGVIGSAFKLSLKDLLARYGYRHCTDPRDRIYALLGCIEDPERRSLEQYLPDYNLTYYETVIVAHAHSRHFLENEPPAHDHLLRELDHEAAEALLNVSGVLYQLLRDSDVFSESREQNAQIQSQSIQRKARRSVAMVCQDNKKSRSKDGVH